MPSGAFGTLYVVATPIGNLEDFTFRGLRILQSVDLIAAEDTRRTAKLLAHYDVRKPVVSLREHNEARETPRLVHRLLAGSSIALVSDAGTPAIADPGARLVRAARDSGIPVVPIPGPSAITAALSVSGLGSTEFVFAGFPPASGAARRRFLEEMARERRTIVLFEAPHRISRTLDDLRAQLVNRQILVFKELTKFNESSVIRPIASGREKGEFTLIIESDERTREQSERVDDSVPNLIGRLTDSNLFTVDEIGTIIARVEGVPFKAARNKAKRLSFLVKRLKQAQT